MECKKLRYVVFAGVAVLVGLLGIVAYLFKIPPFSVVGTIKEDAMCDTLSPSVQSRDALKSMVPASASYDFKDDVGDLRTDDQDDYYRTDCFMYGDDRLILTARTELMRSESTDGWIKGVVESQTSSPGELHPFPFQDAGVVSPTVAGVFVPCVSPGHVPGGQYNLSVVVELVKSGGASDKKKRAGLVELAESAASYAHSKAKCDIPLR